MLDFKASNLWGTLFGWLDGWEGSTWYHVVPSIEKNKGRESPDPSFLGFATFAIAQWVFRYISYHYISSLYLITKREFAGISWEDWGLSQQRLHQIALINGALVLIGSRLGLFHEGLDRGPATGHWASLDGESQDSRGGFKHGKPMAYCNYIIIQKIYGLRPMKNRCGGDKHHIYHILG